MIEQQPRRIIEIVNIYSIDLLGNEPTKITDQLNAEIKVKPKDSEMKTHFDTYTVHTICTFDER